MSKDGNWIPPQHAGIKEKIVQGYLRIWFTRLSSTSSVLSYLDGFAGPGIYDDGIIGSPIVAMEEAAWALKRHTETYIRLAFIEKNRTIFEKLKKNVENYQRNLEKKYGPSVTKRIRVLVENMDFRYVIETMTFSPWKNRLHPIPSFVFLDPFGITKSGFSFDWLRTFAERSNVELLLNFYVQGIERNRSTISKERINQIFGEYIDISNKSVEEIVKWFRNKIRQELNMKVLLYEMRNTRNRILYYLVFITKSPEGIKKMKEVMGNLSGKYFYFTNEGHSDQLHLLRHDFPEFQNDFLNRFAKQEITVDDIFNYYVASDEYIWTEKDIREFLKHLEDDGSITVKPFKTDGKKRRKNTFPSNAVIVVL
ncbi:hypothetical protein DRN97_08220 [Methanosarcinales archaeon]|nr:MAG: hypothetical protein DRN97_08220 [Methanosarcinales archaeon]